MPPAPQPEAWHDDNSGIVARYLADGTLDVGFGDGGVARPENPPSGRLTAGLVVLPSGRIVTADSYLSRADEFTSRVLALTDAGQPDAGFGENGVVVEPVSSPPRDVVFQPDARLLVARSPFVANHPLGDSSLEIGAFTLDGVRDETFGARSSASANLGPLSDHTGAIALAPDGRVFLGGTTIVDFEDASFDVLRSASGIVRFTRDGVLDDSFGAAGIVMVPPLRGRPAFAGDIVVQPDGKPVFLGFEGDAWVFTPDERRTYLVRLQADDATTSALVSERLAVLAGELERLLAAGVLRRKLARPLDRAMTVGLERPGSEQVVRALRRARKAVTAFLARLDGRQARATLDADVTGWLAALARMAVADLDVLLAAA